MTSNEIPGENSETTVIDCSSANTIFTANQNAKGRKIYNRVGNGTLWVKYGTGVTNEATCSFAITAGQTWEMPWYNGVPEYSGIVTGILATGTNINATEITK